MRIHSRIILLFFVLSVFFGCRKVTENPPLATDGKTGMLEAVNALRSVGCRCGADTMPPVPILRWNDQLEAAAGAHAADMAKKQYFSHFGLDGSLPVQRALQAGYPAGSILENIAQGYATLPGVMTAWKNSEAHCKAMMNSGYSEMGAGRASDYWVQEFGKPSAHP